MEKFWIKCLAGPYDWDKSMIEGARDIGGFDGI